jgi:ferredoxin
MINKINQSQLILWLNTLTDYSIYLPEKTNHGWEYLPKTDFSAIDFTGFATVESIKKFYFSQVHDLFAFKQANGSIQLHDNSKPFKKTILFGVRPCDARAISLLDLVFAKNMPDNSYLDRRKQIIVIGMACRQPPTANCFCTSVGSSPYDHQGMDILLTKTKSGYFAESVTAAGNTLIALAGQWLEATSLADQSELKTIRRNSRKQMPRHLYHTESLPEKIKNSFYADFWQHAAFACVKCGICTYLCPTCHCFDIHDEIRRSAPFQGKRVRTWDSCQFPDFTMHSSGHNPRLHQGDRLRQRLAHKFWYFFENHALFQCTGCGRCISYCPVGIDLIDILSKVTENETL